MTLSPMNLFVILSIDDTEHNSIYCLYTKCLVFYCCSECHNAESRYAMLSVIMVKAIMLSVIMLKVIMLMVIMLSAIILGVIMLSVIMLKVIMLS
jgi:hypothetical protein